MRLMALAVLVFSGVAFAVNTDLPACAPVIDHSVTEDTSNSVLWRRAIDQDNLNDLWRLLPKVDITGTNEKGKTAVMAAAKSGDQCLMDELIKRGLSLNDISTTGGTTLMYAVLGNQLPMINNLLQAPLVIDAQSANGWTALMIAAAKGFDKAVVNLALAGADPSLADVYQWSPLMRAIDNRHTSVIEALLQLPDVDLTQKNENGATALHLAAQAGDKPTVVQLLQSGADPLAEDRNGITAEQMAHISGFDDIAELIRKTTKP